MTPPPNERELRKMRKEDAEYEVEDKETKKETKKKQKEKEINMRKKQERRK